MCAGDGRYDCSACPVGVQEDVAGAEEEQEQICEDEGADVHAKGVGDEAEVEEGEDGGGPVGAVADAGEGKVEVELAGDGAVGEFARGE